VARRCGRCPSTSGPPSKTPRPPEQGEARWDVQVLDQDDVLVATYELLTMVRAR
jgi:acyl dehydratase